MFKHKKRKQESNLPRGQDDRPSVDWMDFDKPNGGPTRRAVNLGIEELPSERHSEDAAEGSRPRRSDEERRR